MRLVDLFLVIHLISFLVIAAALFLTVTNRRPSPVLWAFRFTLIGALTWTSMDALYLFLAYHYQVFSYTIGTFAGIGALTMAAGFYFSCEYFAEPTNLSGTHRFRHRIRLAVILAICAVVAGAEFSEDWISNRRIVHGKMAADVGLLFLVTGAWKILLAVSGIGTLLFRYRHVREARSRKQIKFLLLGSSATVCVVGLLVYVMPLLGQYEWTTPGIQSCLIFVSYALYAVIVHRLYDLRMTILKVLIRIVISIAAGLLLCILLLPILNMRQSFWVTALLLSFFALIMLLHGRKLQPRIEKLLLRQGADVQRIIRELSRGNLNGPQGTITFEALLENFLGVITRSLGASGGFILAMNRFDKPVSFSMGPFAPDIPDTWVRIVRRYQNRFFNSREFIDFMGEIRLMEDAADGLGYFSRSVARRFPMTDRLLGEQFDRLKTVGYKLFVPLMMADEACGLMVLGEREDGNPYYVEDIELMDEVRSFMALHIKNFVYFDELNYLKNQAEQEVELLSSIMSHKRVVRHNVHGRTLIYRSEVMGSLMAKAAKAANMTQPVLIQGETGTGKELMARIIHENIEQAGRQETRPFIAVNCGAIPESLWEDEFFGHVKGAFTDARSDRAGFVEAAGNGTLFLDEIGEAPLNIQTRLLRLLQEKVYTPLGSTKSRPANCRFIFATNRDLEDMVREKQFREDLYYRVNVFQIVLPALRERPEDIPLLVEHYINLFREETGTDVLTTSRQAMAYLENYHWPGNIREMENLLIRCLAGASGKTLSVEDLPPAIMRKLSGQSSPAKLTHIVRETSVDGNYTELIKDYRRRLIQEALSKAADNKTMAARILGIPRNTLNNQIRELKM